MKKGKTAYNNAQPGTRGHAPHCGFANGLGRLRGNSNTILSGANFAKAYVRLLKIGSHCELRARPPGDISPTPAASSLSAHAFPGHFWLG